MSSNPLFQSEGFRQATHYVHTHRGKVFVVYISRDILSTQNSLAALIHDLALMHTLGVKLILVPGLRALINQKTGIQAERTSRDDEHITDLHSIEQVKEVAENAGANIKTLFSVGLINTPMSGTKLNIVSGDFVRTEPTATGGKMDDPFSTGYSIAKRAIHQQLDEGNIVLVTPLGHSATGNILLLAGAKVAMHTACALQSGKLILILGKFRLQDNKEQGEEHYSIREARELAKKLSGHKQYAKHYLDIAIQACSENVKHVHLVDAKNPGALLEELYSLDGAATLVTAQTYDNIRPATLNDIDGITKLIQPFIEKGALVSRSREQLELEIGRFDVIERDGVLLTCGTLYTFPEENAAEVGCLAVHPKYQSIGRGSKMLMHLERKAYKAGFSKLFVLTTQTEHWFQEHGFKPAKVQDLPMKKQAFYDYLRNSKVYSKTIQ